MQHDNTQPTYFTATTSPPVEAIKYAELSDHGRTQEVIENYRELNPQYIDKDARVMTEWIQAGGESHVKAYFVVREKGSGEVVETQPDLDEYYKLPGKAVEVLQDWIRLQRDAQAL